MWYFPFFASPDSKDSASKAYVTADMHCLLFTLGNMGSVYILVKALSAILHSTVPQWTSSHKNLILSGYNFSPQEEGENSVPVIYPCHMGE
jgi:hypothetical protein